MRVPPSSLLIPVIVGCGNFMLGLDQSAVMLALPAISASLGVSPVTLGLIMTSYLAALVSALPLGGWLCDRIGPRAVYTISAFIFAGSSLFAGFSGTLLELMAPRIVQGAAAALISISGQIVLLRSFDKTRILKISVYTSLATQIAPMVGPIVAGILIATFSWRGIFLVNIPIGIVVCIAGWHLFPSARRAGTFSFDLIGFASLMTGTVLLVTSIHTLSSDLAPAWVSGAGLLVALMALSFAVHHSLRVPTPLLDMSLLRIRTFRISLLTGGGIDTMTVTGAMFMLPLMLQVGMHFSPIRAGYLMFLAAAGAVLARVMVPSLVRWIGFRSILVVNTPVLAASMAAFALLKVASPILFTIFLIFGFGVLRSIQWGSTANLSYADIDKSQFPQFSVLYYVLYQLTVAISLGFTFVLLATLSDGQPELTLPDFQHAFLILASLTLFALAAYHSLLPGDGHKVSGRGH